jgi:hypothetical protein
MPFPIGGSKRISTLSAVPPNPLLSDTGGSNGYRCRAWKTELQAQLANSFGLTLTVAHYPTGASK